ncbi:hypothetical protein EPUS_03272 [Endocarpon pusillum Z07020]|uniref:Nudix hydrolase domain-containing protein n=1 Tax=Endocarpon pusillum (strain Z07020 / HMAS-L-300199) TaxID=1263415 RepID=U1GFV1_ENDPU|nr:uncharacterized protein EPUS_03272 [Endocarpon pusillum Z07020]ERF70993.1 hypothetical protein EPUS_03272 [Endocarpon pusillum Z07020]
MAAKPYPRIGVAALIISPSDEILMGKRKGAHGGGTLAPPGGHLEHGESLEECAARETLEETDLVVSGMRFLTATNDIFSERDKHYVTLYVACELENPYAEPKIMEPDKCEGWEWVKWHQVAAWADAMASDGDNSNQIGGGENRAKTLFLPLLNLFRQRPGFDPVASFRRV